MYKWRTGMEVYIEKLKEKKEKGEKLTPREWGILEYGKA